MRQPESAAWWAGLWLFPTAPSSGDEPERVLEVAVEQAANLPVVVGPRRERLHHSVTRYRITLDVYDCRPAKRRPLGRNRAAAWKRPEQLQKLAMPAVHRRIADHLVRL